VIRILPVLIAALLLGACAHQRPVELPAPIAPFPAVALAVEAGDSVVLRHTRTQRIERVRLEGVAAPGDRQPYAAAAGAALAEALGGRSLVVSATAREADGSLRGWAYPPCGPAESVNASLTRAGNVWARPGPDAAPALIAAQEQARGERAGLWLDEAPIPPWQWAALGADKRATILAAAPVSGAAGHGYGAGYGSGGEPASSLNPPVTGVVPVDYSWLFGGVASAPADDEPMNSAWLTDWRGLLDELF
jgi:endonuclease YncB( thermonuclease family)